MICAHEVVQGASYRSLFDSYNATDLVAYSRKHELRVTGRKPELIKRIISFLETGDKGFKAAGGKKGGKRKGAPKKGGAAKKAKTEGKAEEAK